MTALDNLNQNVFGLTALIVALVALLTTVLQVLQQYFSSAEGYRRCAESVMGLWCQGTHRKLRLREFRIEVVFETPVLFVASPDNERGPIKGKPIYYIDGTEESYRNTKVLAQPAQERADKESASRVHTADDERASWVTLLSALQLKEENSRAWDKSYSERTPPRFSRPRPDHRLVVGLQGKTRSWDFISSSITKPYATTAICHLVEMMAMLGLHWRVFDQSSWNLRAEGNGFILTSTTVHGLGVMVAFAVTGKSQFEESRPIPCKALKELAFGVVPNIFESDAYLLRETDAQSVELKFGTIDDGANTLEDIGASAQAIASFRKDHKHIFSISFEIIGMLGKVFRIRGSNFKMVPNPTSDAWLKQKSPQKASWKIERLMQVFQTRLREFVGDFGPDHELVKISRQWDAITRLGSTDEAKLNIEVREAIHNALDSRTEYLLSKNLTQAKVLKVVIAHISKVLQVLSDPNSPLNIIVLANKEEPLINYYFDYVRPSVVDLDTASKKGLMQDEIDKISEERNIIWMSLIFRMLCWLLLHDFDKADICMVPSDLKGSRMPVYIG